MYTYYIGMYVNFSTGVGFVAISYYTGEWYMITIRLAIKRFKKPSFKRFKLNVFQILKCNI